MWCGSQEWVDLGVTGARGDFLERVGGMAGGSARQRVLCEGSLCIGAMCKKKAMCRGYHVQRELCAKGAMCKGTGRLVLYLSSVTRQWCSQEARDLWEEDTGQVAKHHFRHADQEPRAFKEPA